MKSIFICGSLAVLTVCMSSTGNKWQWMIYLFITILAVAVCIPRALPRLLLYAAVSGILWMSMLERLFFKNSNWFHDMIALNKRISSAYYYFPDHDNMMHWKLLHHFSHAALFYCNLDNRSYKVYKVYYQQTDPGAFKPGWLIINQAYTIRSAAFLKKVDSLENIHFFTKKTSRGDVRALLIDSPGKLAYMQSLVQSDD